MSEFRLPRFRSDVALVDASGKPTITFQRWWQSVVTKIEAQEAAQDALLEQISDVLGLTEDLETAVTAAQTAADDAQVAADAAATSADGANSVAALTNSGVSGCTITATDAGANVTVAVSAHTRLYGDGTSLAIAGPTNITGLAYSTTYFIYYDDATRLDTTPTYATTTNEGTAAQTGDRHLVGRVVTPAAAAPPTDGDYVQPPGVGNIP